MAKRQEYMWGAWVVWNVGEPDWAWDVTDNTICGVCLFFTDTKDEIMPLVKSWRMLCFVKSCTPVKVPIPEGPPDA